jgi:hypothetical protein
MERIAKDIDVDEPTGSPAEIFRRYAGRRASVGRAFCKASASNAGRSFCANGPYIYNETINRGNFLYSASVFADLATR